MDKFILAPLAGYTDKAMRELALFYGADIAVTEMVSAEGLSRDSAKTKELLERADGEERLIMQLFAPSADPIERAMPKLLEYKPTMIDINAGCPVPKVVKTGAGSALMKEPEKIKEIVKAIKSFTDIPVSVKFRLGWDSSTINFIEFAEKALEGGADALTLHARTRSQGYAGFADRAAFKALAKAFKSNDVTLYASGDVFTPEDALKRINEDEMDGVMFARGAIGNPFIFKETKELINTGSYTLPTPKEKIETALRHYDFMVKYYGVNVAGPEMRKHAMAYLKGLEGSKEAKARITKAITRDEYLDAFRLVEPTI